MKPTLFLAADYANISREGKLNIMGVFQTITAPSFPLRHPLMFLVLGLTTELGEQDQTRDITVKLLDADGKEVLVVSTKAEIPPQSGLQPHPMSAVLELRDVVIEKPGRYMFVLLIDRDYKADLSLHVLQA